MEEKTMVNDILSGVKASLTAYQTAISEQDVADASDLDRRGGFRIRKYAIKTNFPTN